MHPEPLPNSDAVPDPLEAQLRALPAPVVPATLEARLLAAVQKGDCPPKSREQSPFWTARAYLAGAVAAACVLALVAWWWRTSQAPTPTAPPKAVPYVKSARPTEDSARMTAWQVARNTQEETALTPFVWPLPETKPVLAWKSLPAADSD